MQVKLETVRGKDETVGNRRAKKTKPSVTHKYNTRSNAQCENETELMANVNDFRQLNVTK